MYHPTRVHGLLTVNNTATTSRGRFMERLTVVMTMMTVVMMVMVMMMAMIIY